MRATAVGGARWSALRARLPAFALLPALAALAMPARASVQVIFNGGVDEPSTAATEYSTIMGLEELVWDGTLATHEGIVPTAGTFQRFKVVLDVAPGLGRSYAFALMRNGAASGLGCTVSGTATTCSDLSTSVAMAAGDTVALRSVPSGTPDLTHVATSMAFDGAMAAESIYVGGSGNGTLHNTQDRRLPVHGIYDGGANNAARWQTDLIVPTTGSFRKLFVRISVAPGSGTSRAFAIELNDVATPVSCTIAGTATTCSDTLNSIAVAPGDLIRVLESPSSLSNPASATVQLGVVFAAANDGEFMLVQSGAAALPASVSYVTPSAGRSNAADAVEANHVVLGQACTAKRIFANLNGSSGAGTSYTLRLRVNGADAALACTMADPAVSCNAAVDVTIPDDALLSTQSTPTGSPTLRSARVTYLLTSGPSRARRIWFVE